MPKTKSFLSEILPPLWDVVFSIKAFAAAMLALFIALYFDLPNPYWAVTTVYIVAQPLSGMSTSKAVYRLIGTAAGGTMSVILVPNLVNAPELLTVAIALWVGFCLTISLLDRSPRSYAFMLAGYTTALTGFPIVGSPETVFTYTTSRVIEIGVAIICTALVSRIVFPLHAGPVLSARIGAWLNDGARLAAAVLQGRAKDDDMVALVRKLGADSADIRLFTTHVSYDTSVHRDMVGASRELQGLMATLLPIISGLADVQAAMTKAGYQQPVDEKSLASRVIAWMDGGESLSAETRAELLSLMETVETEAGQIGEWAYLLARNFNARLRDLVQVWSDCVNLQQEIISGGAHPRRFRHFGLGQNTARATHVDYGMAMFSGFSAALAIIVASAFWILTGWSSGAGAPMMAGILVCFFAAMDNPTPFIRKFLVFSMIAMVMSFVFVFAVMPVLTSFSDLVLALGFLFLPLGLLVARPATFLAGMALCTNLPTMLTLQSRPSLDLSSFLNSNLGTILGTVGAMAIAALVRSVGTEWSARRLLRAGWADIAAAARRPRSLDLQTLLHRMLDRFALIAPRLATIPEGSAVVRSDILKDMRVGINVIGLQSQKGLLLARPRRAVEDALEATGAYYEARQKNTASRPQPSLLAALDAALLQTASHIADNRGPTGSSPHSASDAARLALVGLRYNLFPDDHGPAAVVPDVIREAAE